MNDVYRYRIGSKWYSFDKNLLDPQDVQLFERATWQDKLNIIKIYKDLKSVEDSTSAILSTKKEDPNKDKRRAEYNEKRKKINDKITEANKKNDETATAEALEELKNLEIEYADIVKISKANTVNMYKVNNLKIKNIEKLASNSSKAINELNNVLSDTDLNKIKDLLNASNLAHARDLANVTKKLLNVQYDQLNKQQIEIIEALKEFKDMIDEVDTTEAYDWMMKVIKFPDSTSILIKFVEITKMLDKTNITIEDIKTLMKLPNSVEVCRKYVDKIHYIAEYWRMFKKIDNSRFEGWQWFQDNITTNQYADGNITDVKSFLNLFTLKNGGIVKQIQLRHYKTGTRVHIVEPYLFDVLYQSDPETYDIIRSMGEPSQAGFLGLRTNKEAKQEAEKIFKHIQNLQNQIDEIKKDIKELKDVKPSKSEDVESLKPKAEALQQQSAKLKHVKPLESSSLKTPKPSEFKELLERRRRDITPSPELSDSEEWADGLNLSTSEGCGGILGELSKDLEKYGLRLTLSKDQKSYFVNVFKKRKAKGEGIAEAKELTEAAEKGASYAELRDLYEDLYKFD